MSKPNKSDFLLLVNAYLRAKRRDYNLSKYLDRYGTTFENTEEPLEIAIEDWLLQFDLGESMLYCIEQLIENVSFKIRINEKEISIDSLDSLYDIYYEPL